MRRPLPLLEPDAVRYVPRSFGWADHTVRRHLKVMTPIAVALYFFLILAADAQGLSCWRIERIARELGHVDFGDLFQAREALIALRLIAYRPWSEHCVDGIYQVLPVPQTTREPLLVGEAP
ncbi:MAG: hypothetical protein JXA57_16025 [Armatimonadetes bacterium]|nr:hypothetical protein [Armatimonadota bacterium]